MKKNLALALVILAVTASMSAALDSSGPQSRNLGKDSNNMTWYLTEYGINYGVPYATARKYYTNPNIKKETIEQLMSYYGLRRDKASMLYFTEYGYEFTEDGTQYATSFICYYDFLGNELYTIYYDNSDEAHQKVFVKLSPNTPQSKGYAYAVGNLH